MLGRFLFRPGQRVRLSPKGRASSLIDPKHNDRGGVVTKVDEFNVPSVKWDGRKTASGYHPDFIQPDHRPSSHR